MELEEQLTNLSIYYDKEEIILLTAAQTQKDLLQFNIEFILEEKTIASATFSFDDLLHSLKPIMEDLINYHKDKLVQLFYRIDVSEIKIGKAFELESFDKTVTEISTLILHRELKKVLIRRYYKQS